MAIRRDPETLAAIRAGFVAAIERGHGDASAAGLVGVDPSTVRHWKAEGRADIEAGRTDTALATFVADCARANAARIERHLAVVENAAVNEGDAQSSRWLLAAWDRETFGGKQSVELTGKDGGAVKVETGPDLSKLSKDELRAWHALAVKAAGDNATTDS